MVKKNQTKSQQQQRALHFLAQHYWKLLSLLVLIISIGIYYYQYHHHYEIPSSSSNYKNINIIKDFLYETWSTLSFSTTVIYRKFFSNNNDQQNRYNVILEQLLKAEQNVSLAKSSRIAIGLGVCTDLVIRALDIFDQFDSPDDAQPHDHIDNWSKFLELFAYYFQRGAASERYIKSKQVYQKLINLIEEKKIPTKEAIGSNAPLISLRFAQEGFENILLGAQITEKLLKKFPNNIEISGPIIDQDDYHLILEYNINEQWNQYRSPRANRLIVHSDDNNVKLLSRTKFFKQLPNFRPDLLVLTGLHMLDNSPIDFQIRQQAIEDLAKDLEQFRLENQEVRTHFEMAAFTENRLLDSVVNQIFPHIDSFGMNEQEATNLLSLMKFGNISYSSNPFPRVAYVLDEMRELFSLLESIGNNEQHQQQQQHRRISRIHVHTLAYQVVMTRIDEKLNRSIWKSNRQAMAKASLTAYRYTCNLPEIDLKQVNILLDDSFAITSNEQQNVERVQLNEAIRCWQENLDNSHLTGKKTRVEICLAIGMVCTNVLQTVGAGDNISASGLMFQI
uniref:ADP-dependent glucokinase-like n=1 Tax=Dermatophagoides pteronyssinus TaxID=6956 RepID=A0A6P6YCV5_DERPT|nr:ADP-dependent glucokinase-like [Dermatophagoides pteronyssinus]